MNGEADAQILWEKRGKHMGSGLDKRGYGVSVFTIDEESCQSCGQPAPYLLNLKTHSPTTQAFTFCKDDANKFLVNFGLKFRLQ